MVMQGKQAGVVWAALFVAVASGAIWLASGSVAGMHDRLLWQDAEVVAEGAEIYATHCAACHGSDLAGQTEWQVRRPDGRLPAPPHDATGHTWHHADALLIDLTTRGTAAVVGGGYESDMPGFGDVLSAQDIIAVLSYIKSTWPPRVIAIHDGINAAAQTR